jgi:hypothetical protein
LDISALREEIEYSPETGLFTWKKWKRGRRKSLGAGCRMKIGYISITIFGRQEYAHRLAWLHVYGRLPRSMSIDHINGDPSDNRIENLRLGTHGQNMQNLRSARSDNRSTGVLGVCFDRSRGKYLATIHKNGRQYNLGRFATVDEASAAYVSAKRRLHEFNCL